MREGKTMSGLFIKTREIILSLIVILCLVLYAGFVFGTVADFAVTTPTNASNTSDSTPDVVFTAVSDVDTNFSCQILINDSYRGINATTLNSTATTITCNSTLDDGYYNVYVSCTDTNGTTNSNISYFRLDTVAPTVTLVSPTTTTGSYDQNWIYINVTSVDATVGLDTVNITLYNSSYVLINQTTNTSSPAVYNFSGLSDGTYYINATGNDSVGNNGSSATYTIILDTTDPSNSISFTNDTGAVDMVLSFNTTVTDEDLSSCYYTIYQNSTETNVIGTVSGSASTFYCTATIDKDDFLSNGYFILGVHTEDNAGNYDKDNQTNLTINKLEAGWNLMQAERNSTLGTFNYTGVVSHISLYSNTNQNYTSWVKGTATNENETIIDGDPVYVYVSEDSYYLRTWAVDMATRNLSYSKGWGQATHFNTSDISTEDLCNEAIDNTSADIKYVTYVDTDGTYQSHRCGFSFNTINIPRGYGYWLYVNTTTTQVRNRE